MLIKALCDYYDYFESSGIFIPYGYEKIKADFLVCLNGDGTIDNIINRKNKDDDSISSMEIMPNTKSETKISAKCLEYRPTYLFGLSYKKKELIYKDEKNINSHNAFVETCTGFFNDLDSPVINAFKNFIIRWNPEEETQNPHLLALGGDFSKGNYVFCLSGYPDKPLHLDNQVIDKWNKILENMPIDSNFTAQCSILGEVLPIARIHDPIKGVYGTKKSGAPLTSYNKESTESYGFKQSYNSCVSVKAMHKYTIALNYLLNSKKNHIVIGNMTIVYWAFSKNKKYTELFDAVLKGSEETMPEDIEKILKELVKDAKYGKITKDRAENLSEIDKNIVFCIAGLKANTQSRIIIDFFEMQKFSEIFKNIIQHQCDISVAGQKKEVIPLGFIQREYLPNYDEKKKQVITNEIIHAIIKGIPYPRFLESAVMSNILSDGKVSATRAGIIRGCINRRERYKNKKEIISMQLDTNSTDHAYLCGRMFAVYEKIYKEANPKSASLLSASYIKGAMQKPAKIMSELQATALQNLKKLKYGGYYYKLMIEIGSSLSSEFPPFILPKDRGKFISGYFAQLHDLYTSKKKENKEEDKEKQEAE